MSAFGAKMGELSINLKPITESIPRSVVERILQETDRESVRRRKLPAYLMVYYVIALGLMVSDSAREVLRLLVGEVRDQFPDSKAVIASRAAICKARQRLGAEPIRRLFDQVVRPLAKRSTEGAWLWGLRLVAIDGSSLTSRTHRRIENAMAEQVLGKGKRGRGR
jgi:hypothetical protein